VTEDEALKRGAEAGWALAKALEELCPDKIDTAIEAAITAMLMYQWPKGGEEHGAVAVADR
jgi:hypothetical protein